MGSTLGRAGRTGILFLGGAQRLAYAGGRGGGSRFENTRDGDDTRDGYVTSTGRGRRAFRLRGGTSDSAAVSLRVRDARL